MQDQDDLSVSSQQRNRLPPLAPRDSQPTSSRERDRKSGSGSGRPPRLSHRSRAGCWTCRARKVKCDEIHPRCGPCTRLSRACDWDHRWNFSDATEGTKSKHGNVTTSGNTVWDPQARQDATASQNFRLYDDMPAFAVLTNDDERERKAETQRPGTFGVVVTPESFADLPEYAATTSPTSRRTSIQSQASSFLNHTSPLSATLSRSRTDPNVIVLDRFEDVQSAPVGSNPTPPDLRRPSLPDRIQYLSISTTSSPTSNTFLPSPTAQTTATNDPYVSHFRHYVLSRLVQPQIDSLTPELLVHTTRDTFELEARRFAPLHEAISALSALNMSYNGTASVDEAHLHYGRALSPQTKPISEDELLADGSFLCHFLLFLYDICIPMQHDEDATDMWAIHLDHLQRIAMLRDERLGPEKYGYILWAICELDVHACLLGSGACNFVRTILEHNMMPALESQIPSTATSLSTPYLASEVSIFPSILALRQGLTLQIAKIAQAAQNFRREAKQRRPTSPSSYARWQASAAQLETELVALWTQAYPAYLGPESPQAGHDLPLRPRYVLEQAYLLYQAATIYLRTSMFPGHRRIPVANQTDVLTDTERRIMSIVALATTHLEARYLERRTVIFPLFIAGFATTQPDLKVQALNIMKAFEGHGIGQNTYTTRKLLAAVYEEQRRAVEIGGRMEDVDWLEVAADRSLKVVNCGL